MDRPAEIFGLCCIGVIAFTLFGLCGLDLSRVIAAAITALFQAGGYFGLI